MEFFWIGIGGFLGANARYFLGHAITQRLGTLFPYGTLIVNLTGAFLIGVIFTVLTDRVVDDRFWRHLVVTGFLGGYTTFSSYTYEAIRLMQEGRWSTTLLYVVGSNILGLLACFAGVWVTKAISA
ncbi:MAG TPA: fluoride efflux transporter CrcB [Thermomicrobiales bacterium]|nr:fluoride efflux transporter CrcB [Thermomicrobiales bacterium]